MSSTLRCWPSSCSPHPEDTPRRFQRPERGRVTGLEESQLWAQRPCRGITWVLTPREPLQASKPGASILLVHRIPWENLMAKSVEHKIHHFKMDIQ